MLPRLSARWRLSSPQTLSTIDRVSDHSASAKLQQAAVEIRLLEHGPNWRGRGNNPLQCLPQKLQRDRKPEIHFHRLSAVCAVSARGHISLLSLSFVQTMWGTWLTEGKMDHFAELWIHVAVAQCSSALFAEREWRG